MKRLIPSHELVVDTPTLLVRLQLTVFKNDLFLKFFKALTHSVRIERRVGVVDGHFEKAAVQEFPLDSGSRGVRQGTLLRLDMQYAQSRLLTRYKNVKIQGMLGRPIYKFFGSISPFKPERRLYNPLRAQVCAGKPEESGSQKKHVFTACFGKKKIHRSSLPYGGRIRKSRTIRRGFALVEATMAMSLLSVTGLLLLKISLNVIHPRQYSLQQILSDSYLTFERAKAERIPFEDLVANDSPWPTYPEIVSETVEIGKLPGGRPVTGVVSRTRIPDAENYPIDGGTGTVAINPAAMKIWRVQSILRYEISGRTYVKSRTLVRAQ